MTSPFTTTSVSLQRLSFGKYKGQLVADLVKSDPSYLLWAHSNVSFFSLTDEQLKVCRQNAITGEENEDSPDYVQHALYDDYDAETIHCGAFGYCD